MPISFTRAALVLGLLAVGGPVAIDTYLPALPSIATDLGTSPTGVQMSLMAYFLAIAMFQPVYGPLSDMYGRRAPLLLGTVVFTLGGIGCAVAPNIETLIALRFVQGIGGCAAMIIPRAVVRDLYTGVPAARLMALMMLVFSIGPIVAPFIGSVINEVAGWRMIFVFVAAVGIASIGVLLTGLPETRDSSRRAGSNLRSAMANYAEQMKDGHFMALALVAGGAIAGFFTFVAGSSFVFIDHFGFTPMQYSIAFSFNAVGFFSVAQLNGYFGARIGLANLVRIASTVYWVLMVLLTGYFVLGGDSVVVMMAGLWLAFASLGLVMPGSAVLALDRYGHAAGTASSLLGSVQFGTGAAAVGVMSLAGRGEPLPMIATIAGFSTLVFVMAQLVLSQPREAAVE